VQQNCHAVIIKLTFALSENITAGLVFSPAAGLRASLDAYQIDVKGRFGQSRSFAVPAGLPNPLRFTSVSYFTNDFDTRTRGIDAVLSYGQLVGPGRLQTTLAYNYNDTMVTGGTSATIGNDAQRRIFEERLPRHNATATLAYELDAVELRMHGRYYGPWTDNSDNASGQIFQRFGSMLLFDASLTYRVTENARLTAGAENIFDAYPDEATFQASRGLVYSRNAPYDTDGGLYYVRLGLTY
jgi:iron complex outermembrane receptor protein